MVVYGYFTLFTEIAEHTCIPGPPQIKAKHSPHPNTQACSIYYIFLKLNKRGNYTFFLSVEFKFNIFKIPSSNFKTLYQEDQFQVSFRLVYCPFHHLHQPISPLLQTLTPTPTTSNELLPPRVKLHPAT